MSHGDKSECICLLIFVIHDNVDDSRHSIFQLWTLFLILWRKNYIFSFSDYFYPTLTVSSVGKMSKFHFFCDEHSVNSDKSRTYSVLVFRFIGLTLQCSEIFNYAEEIIIFQWFRALFCFASATELLDIISLFELLLVNKPMSGLQAMKWEIFIHKLFCQTFTIAEMRQEKIEKVSKKYEQTPFNADRKFRTHLESIRCHRHHSPQSTIADC